MISRAGLSRRSSMSRLYATPRTSTRLPFTGLESSLRASATLRTTKAGISELISLASSIIRVLYASVRIFQER